MEEPFSSLASLIGLIATPEFEEYGRLSVAGFSLQGTSGSAQLELCRGNPARSVEHWSLDVEDVLEQELHLSSGEPIECRAEHALLRAYHEPIEELSFYGRPACAPAVVGALLEAFDAWRDGWSGGRHLLGSGRWLREMLEGGFGALAVGPSSLIDCYVAVLDAEGIKTSRLVLGRRMRWVDHSWEPLTFSPVVLTLGSSYIVCRAVRAKRVLHPATLE